MRTSAPPVVSQITAVTVPEASEAVTRDAESAVRRSCLARFGMRVLPRYERGGGRGHLDLDVPRARKSGRR